MTIRFQCDHCKRTLKAADHLAGTRFKCPACGGQVVAPKAAEGERPMPPAAPAGGTVPPDAEDEIPPVQFKVERQVPEGLDMTPMVDVTFLLLIFFMITAAFALQKSIEVPPPEPDQTAEQARTLEELETDPDFVIIRIGKDNTIWVNEREAPSEQELLVKLREARSGSSVKGSGKGPTNLLVLADRQCRHETVVMALDAGNAVGMENIRLASIDEADL